MEEVIQAVRFDTNVRTFIIKSDVPGIFCAGKSIHYSWFEAGGGGGGQLNYNLSRVMPLRLKVDPFSYQILLNNETHFYTTGTNLLKNSHYFPKLLSFQANFRNFWYQIMKLGLF